MSYIKNNAKLLLLLLMLLIIGGAAYYGLSILPPQLESLQLLEEENAEKARELEFLQQRLVELPETKRKVNNILMETQALRNKIPTYSLAMEMLIEIEDYIAAYDFQDSQVVLGESVQEDENQTYKSLPVTISFTSEHYKALQLLEEISRSEYMLRVHHFAMDNSIQEAEDEEGFSMVSGDTVEAEIAFTLYYMEADEDEQTHSNFMGFSSGAENLFLRPSNEQLEAAEETTVQEEPRAQKPKDQTSFEIYLADIYRSGDNYSFSGYSPDKAPVYAGLVSEKDTSITLNVKDNGYTCLIEDADGKRSEQTVSVKVKNPSLSITSQIQKIMDEMPKIKIYVKNNTSEVIKVNMRGSLLETITIYNENNKIVAPGSQVGKVALNI